MGRGERLIGRDGDHIMRVPPIMPAVLAPASLGAAVGATVALVRAGSSSPAGSFSEAARFVSCWLVVRRSPLLVFGRFGARKDCWFVCLVPAEGFNGSFSP